MQSNIKPKKSLIIFSIVQIILGIAGIFFLYNVPFGSYELRIPDSTYSYIYRERAFFVTDGSLTNSAATAITIMYLVFIGFSLFHILSQNILRSFPLNKMVMKCAKFSPLLGIGIIGCGVIALIGYGQEVYDISYLNYSWIEFGAVCIFVGGIIVLVTGLISNRLSRPARPAGYGYPEFRPQTSPSYPPAPQPPYQPVYACPTCGRPLTFVQQYNRWYCYNCQKYA